MAKTKITDKDKGWKKHGRAVRRGRVNPHMLFGILQEDASHAYEDGGLTSIEVANIHEFGTGTKSGRSGGQKVTIPERSYLRANFDINERKYAAIMRKFQRPVLLGEISAGKALHILGLKVQADTLAYMRKGIDPPKVDGKKAQLKNTSQLYGDLNFEVHA